MNNVFLSIVTGTFNRLDHLRRMVESARASIPRGVTYEIVLVDGGSDDGTIEWAKSQADIVLIEHGALHGAIRAFCDGAKAANGAYVLLGNDDIEFVGDGILRALVHLETHPNCGMVAFADNRPAPGYGEGYKIQTMQAVSLEGLPMHVPYGQVALVPRWLGDVAGWWGADDPIMSKAITYGGDNFLSARIWELGFSVESIKGVQVNDLMAQDDLRARNQTSEPTPSPYYERYPNGVRVAASPQIDNPYEPKLRVLYCPIYELRNDVQRANKRGLREALSRYFFVYELDYVGENFDLPALVAAFKPDVLFTQVHGSSGRLTPALLAQVREVNPRMMVINWNGDVHEEGYTSKAAFEYLKNVDLQLVVNATVLEKYEQLGIQSAYWQVGYEPINETKLPEMAAHDVLFQGDNYGQKRRAFGTLLRGLPYNVGIYGRGWAFADGETLYDFAAAAALIRAAKIVVGDNQYNGYGFVSNRVFETLAHGGFLLHQTVDGMEQLLGLRDGVHYVAWSDEADLQEKIRYWLEPKHAKERADIASKGQQFVRAFHSFDNRVRDLFLDVLPEKVGVREFA